jgi:hypothetical protein
MKHTEKTNDQLELERSFVDAVKSHHKEIEEQMDVARKAIDAAVSIAEQYGIPFRGCAYIEQSYTPTTFRALFKDLDQELVDVQTGVYLDAYSYGGWTHSQICY